MQPAEFPPHCLPFHFGGELLVLDARRALWWPRTKTLAVADLHFGKATSFLVEGLALPPYDTRETLRRLAALLVDWTPERVLSVGDAFHRPTADALLDQEERSWLLALMHAIPSWVWITGNHDPIPPNLPGTSVEVFAEAGLTFAHDVGDAPDAPALICGHYHPKTTVFMGPRRLTRPCFAWSASLCMMPAFGSLAGGLQIRGPVIAPLLGERYFASLCDVPQAICLRAEDLHEALG